MSELATLADLRDQLQAASTRLSIAASNCNFDAHKSLLGRTSAACSRAAADIGNRIAQLREDEVFDWIK
jgi:hypothetical protein